MYVLKNKAHTEAMGFIEKSRAEGLKALCSEVRCGSVIVKDGEVIGAGYNGPPRDEVAGVCWCARKNELSPRFKSDTSGCIHAEQRAIMNALKQHPDKIQGARLYFIRLDDAGETTYAGNPWCTICSKMALESGVTEFVLWHEDGITVYDTEEYNNLSFAYDGE